MTNRITLRINPCDSTEENVRLTDFLNELSAAKLSLSRTEILVGGTAVLDWKIVDLSHNSPATVVLEPAAPSEYIDDIGESVIERFFQYQNSLINSAKAPPEMDRATLLAFKDLNHSARHRRIEATISNGADAVKVDGDVSAVIDNILSQGTTALGTIDGRLEYLNIHGRRKEFRVYPVAGPDRVNCRFNREQLSEAGKAIGRKVRVFGELTYLERDPFPSSIKVETLESLPTDDELPTLMDIRGIAPGMTEKPSEVFVRSVRDAK